jgi:hypothetical protein
MGDADPSRSRADALARRRGAPRPLAPPPDLTVEGAALSPSRQHPGGRRVATAPGGVPEPPSAISTYETDADRARRHRRHPLPNADADASRGPAAASPSESRKRRASPGAPGNAPDADPSAAPSSPSAPSPPSRPSASASSGIAASSPRFSPADVPHVRQEHNWDCGLACALSALRCMGADRTVTLATLRRLCPTRSVWTVDLAHLLRRFGVSVEFCTVTLGANPAFERESFYKASLDLDARRVEALFETAPGKGIAIRRTSVDLETLTTRVKSGRWLVIVLVDKAVLSRRGGASTSRDATTGAAAERGGGGGGGRGSGSSSTSGDRAGDRGRPRATPKGGPLEAPRSSGGSTSVFDFVFGTNPSDAARGADAAASSSYTGHYIVLCGYDDRRGAFHARDPAGGAEEAATVDAAALEEARKSFGTDEDLLFVRHERLDRAAVRKAVEASEAPAGS